MGFFNKQKRLKDSALNVMDPYYGNAKRLDNLNKQNVMFMTRGVPQDEERLI